MRSVIVASAILVSTAAWAGKGGSTELITGAIQSGSVDAIVAELERSEFLPCASCIQPVLQLVDHPSFRVREAAGWWLTRRGVRQQVIANMTARLGAQDPVAARNAADVLSGMRDPSTLKALAAYLKAPLDEDSGKAVASAIGKLGDPSAVAALQAGIGSQLAGVRAASIAALRDLRAPVGKTVSTDASVFMAAFSDGDAGVRVQAAFTAGYLKDASAVPALITLVGDATPQVRKAAAWALGEIGDGSARSALNVAQNDADPLVRSIATAAVGRLH